MAMMLTRQTLMITKAISKAVAWLLLLASLGLPWISHSQIIAADPDWKESEVPAPAAVDLKRLISVDMGLQSQLKWGIDPQSLKITPDGVVRYVVVAQSSSGAVNAMYEGLRCSNAEFKTYARYNKDSGWNTLPQSDWKSLRETGPSNHPLRLAKLGLCDGAAPPSSEREALRQLRSANSATFGR